MSDNIAVTKDETNFAEDCPCPKKECEMWGRCIACVRAHREHRKHVPVCMQEILRDCVKELADKIEMKVK